MAAAFRRVPTDVFQVESDIAAKVVDSLGVALAAKQEKSLADARHQTSQRTTYT